MAARLRGDSEPKPKKYHLTYIHGVLQHTITRHLSLTVTVYLNYSLSLY